MKRNSLDYILLRKQSWVDWSGIHSVKLKITLADGDIVILRDVIDYLALHVTKSFCFIYNNHDGAIICSLHQIRPDDIIVLGRVDHLMNVKSYDDKDSKLLLVNVDFLCFHPNLRFVKFIIFVQGFMISLIEYFSTGIAEFGVFLWMMVIKTTSIHIHFNIVMEQLHGIFRLLHGEWENMTFSNHNFFSNGFLWINFSSEIVGLSTIFIFNSINVHCLRCYQYQFDSELTFMGTQILPYEFLEQMRIIMRSVYLVKAFVPHSRMF